jgi:hypothetical protein
METVTYVIDGSSSHFDNRGNQGVISSGEALWMTAGRGTVHNEIPIDDRPIHTLQLWVNLPRADKRVDADFQELSGDRVARRSLPGADVIVFSGSSGNVTAPTRNHAKVTLVEVRLAPNATFEQELPPDYNGFAVVLEGAGFVGVDATPARGGQVVFLQHEDRESTVQFETRDQGLRALLFAGKPLREPVVARGPFVMNTDEEIEQAYSEFRRDRENFGLS